MSDEKHEATTHTGELAAGREAPAVPTLPGGEKWRGEWDGCVWAIDHKDLVHVWWPPAGLFWDAHPASGSEVERALRAWALSERAQRLAAEARVGAIDVALSAPSTPEPEPSAEEMAARLFPDLRCSDTMSLDYEKERLAAARAIRAERARRGRP